jgi:hypothetical protein
MILQGRIAPVSGMSGSGPFRRSMAELADLEWGDATVLVEHCDAVEGGQNPLKGFLNREEEIAALFDPLRDRNFACI